MGSEKILVTGSSGVLGSAVKRLAGDYPNYEFVFLTSKDCDLTDAGAALKIIKKVNPCKILNLAAVSGGVGLSRTRPATLLRDNVLMTFSILEAARRCNVKKTVMTLSTGMYPPAAPLPLKEENIHCGYPHDSNYGYSFAKRLIDPAIRSYREEYGMTAIGLIPGGIFGENDNFNEDDAPMIPALIRRFYDERKGSSKIVVWGDGSPLREYTYSRDLAKIFMWALDHYDDPQALNVGSTEENSVGQIAYMIADTLDIARDRIFFDTTKPGGVFRKSTDNSRFLKLSNFKYTPFREALEKTIRWFCDTLKNDPKAIRIRSKAKS